MREVDVIVAHHERATLRVGDTFLKVDADQARLDREVEAIAAAPVPTPEVLWSEPNVVALALVPGVPLGFRQSSADAWAAAGRAIRTLHDTPPPSAWPESTAAEYAADVERECAWLHDNDLLSSRLVERHRGIAEMALRPWTSVFTHGDLQPAHVFVSGDEVTGVIDWADACPGDAAFDLAILTLDDPNRLDDVLRGYGEDVGLDVIRGWWSVRSLAAVRWLAEHGFDPSVPLAFLAAN